tara:strand:+ start:937 stop:1233 length:297 start_codon:yes stop_codon:yes gene_type:complete
MFQIFSVFVENNLKHDLKKHKSKLVYSFLIGLIIGSLPTINKMKENFGVQKLIQEQRQIQNQNKEKICKGDNSDYKKFLNLGFPKTAIKKLNICIKER